MIIDFLVSERKIYIYLDAHLTWSYVAAIYRSGGIFELLEN